jgi:hypothetical protein
LSPTSDHEGAIAYLTRLRILIVNPIKTLQQIYICGIQRGTNKQIKVTFLMTYRHYPVVFDEYISLVNKYGLILPFTHDMHKKMNQVSMLLRLNTFSESRMKKFLTSEYDRRKTPPKERIMSWKQIMYYDKGGDENKQVSNIPMMVLIIHRLLRGYIEHGPTDSEYQGIIKINTYNYEATFGHTKKFGLDESCPEDGDDFFYKNYKEILGLCFSHPSASEQDEWKYNLDEVIWGMLYADTVENDYKYDELATTKPPFYLTHAQHERINKYVEDNFCLNKDYYHILEQGVGVLKQAWRPKKKKYSRQLQRR